MRLERILCPIDFSDYAREAMKAAIDLARQGNGELRLVHAYHLPAFAYGEGAFGLPEMHLRLREAAEQGLSQWAKEARAAGVARVSAFAADGVAWDVVCRLAKDEGIDLIVMGTHGRTGLRHALLGSVAEKVVRHAPCPVLVIRPKA
jgi:nucleotide-binding universal stress UspA family protein